MKLAISQIAWAPEQEEEALALLQELSFDGVEIAPPRIAGPQPYDNPDKAADFAACVKEKYGLAVCSLQSMWYGQTGSLFGPEREALRAYTSGAIRFAKAAGVANLVFGNPRNRVMPEGATDEDAVSFFKEIAAEAKQNDTCIGLEANPPLYGTNFMNHTMDAFAMATRVNNTACRVNLDFGTIIINTEDVRQIEGRVSAISHVHISEPELALIQQRDGHKALADILRNENYAGYVSIEMRQQSIEDVRRAAVYLAEVFR